MSPHTKSWEENFDEKFPVDNFYGMILSEEGEIKSFISSLLSQDLSQDRQKEVLKGERNRIIMQIREEERQKLVEEVEKFFENYNKNHIKLDEEFTQQILAILKKK